jgi:hypothetical protein
MDVNARDNHKREMTQEGIVFERFFSLISENLGLCVVGFTTPQGRMSEKTFPFCVQDGS